MFARFSMVFLAVLVFSAGAAMAQQGGSPPASGQAAPEKPAPAAQPKPPLRTIAVLDFDAAWLDDPEQRKETAEVLFTIITDRLGALPDVTLVERREMDRILKEQALNLTGLTDAEKSIKIGKLLGARFLLSGRGFKLDDLIYVTTKVINAETGAYKGIFTTANKGVATSEIVLKVCDGLVEKLPATLNEIGGGTAPAIDPVELLKQRLGNAAKSWLIAAREEHRGPPVIDPAVENELEHLLSGAGQTVETLGKDKAKQLIDGAVGIVETARDHQADYCVVAQGFSEFGKRLNNDLVACLARVETKITDAKTGAVLAAGSLEARATDLGEQLAAKQALRKAARQLLLDLAEKLQKAQPAADQPKQVAPAAAQTK